MKRIPSRIAIAAVIVIAAVSLWYFLALYRAYPIARYFPLNENDKYTYIHHEGPEESIVTITVKDVQRTAKGKEFNFLWEGRYNDRIQTHLLTSQGIFLCRNEHLAGKFPLRAVRSCVPPLLFIPARLKNNISASANYLICDLKGDLRDKEKIEADISFAGFEDVIVEAGEFRCIHFFVRHNFKDGSGNSKHMHTYDFWIAPDVGLVKFIHTFIPFMYIRYIKPGEKTIMNRYSDSFVEVFELKEARIKGKIIKGNG